MMTLTYTETLDNAINEWFENSSFKADGWVLSCVWEVNDTVAEYESVAELSYTYSADDNEWSTITVWCYGCVSTDSTCDDRLPQLNSNELRELACLADIVYKEYRSQQ